MSDLNNNPSDDVQEEPIIDEEDTSAQPIEFGGKASNWRKDQLDDKVDLEGEQWSGRDRNVVGAFGKEEDIEEVEDARLKDGM